MHIRPTLNSCPAGTEPDGRRRLRASQIRDRRILPRQRLLRRCRDAREAAHSDAVQALPKAIAEYPVAAGHTRHDPRKPVYEEIHVLAGNLGLITAGDKENYRAFLSESYEGRTSAKDLDDAELQRLLISLRAMNRVRKAVSSA